MIRSVEMTVPLDKASTARRFRSNGDSDTLTPDARTSVGPSREMSNIQTPIAKMGKGARHPGQFVRRDALPVQ
jgi:hypothetical protein